MLWIIIIIAGGAFGALRARSLGGTKLDMLQWGAGFSLAFLVLALFMMGLGLLIF